MESGWGGIDALEKMSRKGVCLEARFAFSSHFSPPATHPHPTPPTGPPVNVAMAIEVASIDHISEANMVKHRAASSTEIPCQP